MAGKTRPSGTRGFPAVTRDPGILWLVFWPCRRPVALRTIELRSHWGVNMETLVGVDWTDTAFFGANPTLGQIQINTRWCFHLAAQDL